VLPTLLFIELLTYYTFDSLRIHNTLTLFPKSYSLETQRLFNWRLRPTKRFKNLAMALFMPLFFLASETLLYVM